VVLFMTGILLDAASVLAPAVLGLTLASGLLSLLLGTVFDPHALCRSVARSVTALLATLTLVFYVALPGAVRGSAVLSARFTAHLETRAAAALVSLREEIVPIEVTDAEMGMRERIERLRERFAQMGKRLELWARELSHSLVQQMAAYLLDCLIFPLAWFAVILALVRSVIQRLGMPSGAWRSGPRASRTETASCGPSPLPPAASAERSWGRHPSRRLRARPQAARRAFRTGSSRPRRAGPLRG
jgi:hypothetical protein